MRQVNVLVAKTHLSRLIEAIENGTESEIVIARNGKPAVRLVPLAPKPDVSKRIGIAKGLFPPSGFDPALDEEVAALFEGPIFPEAPEDASTDGGASGDRRRA